MRHDVYPLRYNSATPDEVLKSSWTQATSVKKFFFLTGDQTKFVFHTSHVRQRLLMVGPVRSEWHVLRATDGERFVIPTKIMIFLGELLTARTKRLIRNAQFGD